MTSLKYPSGKQKARYHAIVHCETKPFCLQKKCMDNFKELNPSESDTIPVPMSRSFSKTFFLFHSIFLPIVTSFFLFVLSSI